MKGGVLHLIDSGGFYGAEAVILNLCLGLRETDCQPTIGCFSPTGQDKPDLGIVAEKKGIRVRYIPMRLKFDLAAIGIIHRILEEEGIGVIHSHGYKSSIYALILHMIHCIPYIITCHLWTGETLRYHLYIVLERIAMRFAHQVVAVSHPIADDIRSWKMNSKNVMVINNGIDVERYAEEIEENDPIRFREELGLRKETRLIGTIGRLADQKAQHYFLEMASKILEIHDDVEFILVGDGPRRESLHALAVRLGLDDHVHFYGFRSDAVQILRLLDIFVLSSIDEGLPIVILEAMSVGVPIVSSDVGDIPRVIESGKTGIVFPKGDVATMAQSVAKLLHNPALAQELCINAKVEVNEKYSLAMMTQRYYDIYHKMDDMDWDVGVSPLN